MHAVITGAGRPGLVGEVVERPGHVPEAGPLAPTATQAAEGGSLDFQLQGSNPSTEHSKKAEQQHTSYWLSCS